MFSEPCGIQFNTLVPARLAAGSTSVAEITRNSTHELKKRPGVLGGIYLQSMKCNFHIRNETAPDPGPESSGGGE